MSFDELEDIHTRDDQEEWWENNRDNLSKDQKHELLDWIIDDGVHSSFRVFKLVILEASDNPKEIIKRLKVATEQADDNFAWGSFHKDLREQIDGKPETNRQIYSELKSKYSDTFKLFGYAFLCKSDINVEEEILELLDTREETKVTVGVSSTILKYEQIPESINEELQNMLDNEEHVIHVLRAYTEFFTQNTEHWEKLVELALNHEEHLAYIIQNTQFKIQNQHLEEFTEVVKHGIEEEILEEAPIHIYYSEFPERTDQAIDITLCLLDKNNYNAQVLAENIGEENSNFAKSLLEERNKTDNKFGLNNTILKAGKNDPEALTDAIIQEYTVDERDFFLELLQKTIGELYQSGNYHRNTAKDIATFLEDTIGLADFIDQLDRDLIEENPSQPEEHNQEVFRMLNQVVQQLKYRRNFDQSILNQLANYPNLDNYYHDLIAEKIQQGVYHPFLGHLRNNSLILDTLENNWSDIPPENKSALESSESFDDILSEIKLMIWLKSRGIDFNSEVNLHDYNTGDESEKDVDIEFTGNYIDVINPELMPELEMSNEVITIPNNAISKIYGKVSSKYIGTEELGQERTFIAMDLSGTEIGPEQVVSSLHGGLQIHLGRKEDKEVLEELGTTRDLDSSVSGRDDATQLLEEYFDGVIWFDPRIFEEDGNVYIKMTGDVVPNPLHQDDDIDEYCEQLAETIFSN